MLAERVKESVSQYIFSTSLFRKKISLRILEFFRLVTFSLKKGIINIWKFGKLSHLKSINPSCSSYFIIKIIKFYFLLRDLGWKEDSVKHGCCKIPRSYRVYSKMTESRIQTDFKSELLHEWRPWRIKTSKLGSLNINMMWQSCDLQDNVT